MRSSSKAGLAARTSFTTSATPIFRLGSAGRAILDYERALALNPHHPEARANLKILRDQNGAKLLPRSWSSKLADTLSPEIWASLAPVAGWAVLFGIVLLVTSRRAKARFGQWMLCLLSAVVVRGGAGVALEHREADQTLAVITAHEAEARLAPAESAGVAGILPAGSQVRVLSERGEWVYCELPGLGRGWIPGWSGRTGEAGEAMSRWLFLLLLTLARPCPPRRRTGARP